MGCLEVWVVEPNADLGPDEPWVFEHEDDARDFAATFGPGPMGELPFVQSQPMFGHGEARQIIRDRI